jgi:hypothetical protein
LNSAEELNKATQDCSANHDKMTVTPVKMMKFLLFEEDYTEGLVAWASMLIPVAVFWIIGGIVLATIRWISRG